MRFLYFRPAPVSITKRLAGHSLSTTERSEKLAVQNVWENDFFGISGVRRICWDLYSSQVSLVEPIPKSTPNPQVKEHNIFDIARFGALDVTSIALK